MHVDRTSPVPLHYQVYKQLLEDIEQGRLKPGDPLPTEVELEDQLKLSRTTIRQAFTKLTHEGYITRHPGQGSFVAHPKVKQPLHRLTSFSEDMRSRGLESTARTVDFELTALPAHVAKHLGLPETTPAYRIQRLRFADGSPMSLQVVYFPAIEGRTLDPKALEGGGSFYDFLREKYALEIAEADETIDAVDASNDLAEFLDVEVGAPLLRIERVTRTARGEPVEFVEGYYRADRYQYIVHLSR